MFVPLLWAYMRGADLIYFLQLARHLSTDVDDWLKDVRERQHGVIDLHAFVVVASSGLRLLLLALLVLLPRALMPRRHGVPKWIEEPRGILLHLLRLP